MVTLTIFTPTYNRAHTLPQLYDSLCNQECLDFEWVIIDDGSIDKTEDLVLSWKNKNIFSIIYQKQKNGGKMRAHNRGAELANGTLFLCVDSDDYLCENAVELIVDNWKNYHEDNYIAGIIAYKAIKKNGSFQILANFPDNLTLASLTDLYETGFRGDTTIIFRTTVIQQYPFPEIEGEKFVTEAYVYDQIDQNYKYVIFDKGITLCEYLDDGYTSNFTKLYRDNPKGYVLYFNQKVKYCKSGLKYKLRYLIDYITYARYAGNKYVYRDSNSKGLLYVLAYLVSLYYYCVIKNRFAKVK